MTRHGKVAMTAVAGALALILTGPAVQADQAGQTQGQRRHRRAWFERDKVKQELGLTDKQIASLGQEQETHRERLAELRKAQRRAYTALIEVLGAEKLDPEVLARARQALLDASVELDRALVAHFEAVRKVLTAEQWKRLPEVAPRALRYGGAMALRGRGTIQAGKLDTKGGGK